MPTIERTPLQKALLQHLGPGQEDFIPLCSEAIALGQLGYNEEDFSLFNRILTDPLGRQLTVEEVIVNYRLNSFIHWGGEDV